MAADISKVGGNLKVNLNDGTAIRYHKITQVDIDLVKGDTDDLIIFFEKKRVHSFKFADILTPPGATLEEKADAISGLLEESGVGSDVNLSTALGLVPGVSLVAIGCRNSAVPINGDIVDVWEKSGELDYPLVAERLNISSTNLNDTLLGTGAQTVKVVGVDGVYNPIDEIVEMDGTNDVLTTNSYLRRNNFEVKTAGSNGKPLGIIEATQETSGKVIGHIAIDNNRSKQSHFTIPAGKTGFLQRIYGNASRSDEGTIILLNRPLGGVFLESPEIHLFENVAEIVADSAVEYTEKTDLKIIAQRISGASILSISAFYLLKLVDD